MYFLFIAPGLILAVIAQLLLKYAYSRYSKISAGNLTGVDVAQKINEGEGFGVGLRTVPGELTDHFDPVKHVVALSADNAINTSIANIAVVAHEFGHVQQKQVGMSLFKLRTALVPVVNFGSGIGYILIILGFALSAAGLVTLGIILFSSVTIFALVTLPIEINASTRGMNLIKKYNLIEESKLGGAKTVLTAAALTYFAGMLQSLGQLLYFIMLSQRRRD